MRVITFEDVQAARQAIKQTVLRTPLGYTRSGSELLGSQMFLKFENEQMTGSFKIRGALNKILSLSDEERTRGVIASSAGNHAQGVAYAAKKVGTRARVVMPETSPLVKVMATQGYGAEVILHGQTYDDAFAHATELAKSEGSVFVHAFNDPLVMAGQGTIGLEILEDLPELDSIIVPIGGGGLISGVATAIKALRPSCKVYGVVSDAAPAMADLYQGTSTPKPSYHLTIADGIAVKKPNQEIFQNYIHPLVDGVISVTDDEIAEAIVWFLERAKTVVEGSGAVGLAAALKARWELGKQTALVLSGGNIDMNTISMVIERGLSRKGRLARISVVVQDRPGTLLQLTNIIAESRANILDVKHDRLRSDLQISETAIEFLLETRGVEHVAEIRTKLQEVGARVDR